MAKFVLVKDVPATLGKGEIVINPPDFLEQIQENSRKAQKRKITGINHLREVLHAIGYKYDPELNVYKMHLVNYEGIAYKDDSDLCNIIHSILKSEYPKIFDKYLEFQLKNRPIGTKLVYYTGDFTTTGAFYQAGLELIDDKDVESYITGSPKKIVGKPAVTKE